MENNGTIQLYPLVMTNITNWKDPQFLRARTVDAVDASPTDWWVQSFTFPGLHNYGKSHFFICKSTISMAIFNSFLLTFTRPGKCLVETSIYRENQVSSNSQLKVTQLLPPILNSSLVTSPQQQLFLPLRP